MILSPSSYCPTQLLRPGTRLPKISRASPLDCRCFRIGPLRRRIEYRYPHGWVELSYFDCTLADPRAEPEPGTGFRWVPAGELPSLVFPQANEPVLEELARSAEHQPRD